MFRYYFLLGLRSLRRNPMLTALMVLTLAVGVAASMSTLTILHIMSGDPIPHKSDAPARAARRQRAAAKSYVARRRRPRTGRRRTSTRPTGADQRPGRAAHRDVRRRLRAIEGRARRPAGRASRQGLASTRDFFPMFEVPFLYGSAWSAAEDDSRRDVIVLSRNKSEKLFGDDNPVGKTRAHDRAASSSVVGVLDSWNPVPRYTRLINSSGGAFSGEDDAFIPFRPRSISSSTTTEHELHRRRPATPGYAGLPRLRVHLDPVLVREQSAADRAGCRTISTAT